MMIILLLLLSLFTQHFKEDQLRYPRVRQAYHEKYNAILELLTDHKIPIDELSIYLRVFKSEQELEVWVWKEVDQKYLLLTKYPFCSFSGSLGPKRKQGDFQIPEGFYYVDRFNPSSQFYLSLGINYPNQSDVILGSSDPGGDIFIHGDCVTIGCIPLTDDKIKELYVLAVEAKNNGANIPVHLFPARLTADKFDELSATKPGFESLWGEMKPVYDYFEKFKSIPEIQIDSHGRYHIRD